MPCCCLLLHGGELPKHHLWETVSLSTHFTLRGAILKNVVMAIMAILVGRARSELANLSKVVSLFTYRTTETYTLSANSCWLQLTHSCAWKELKEIYVLNYNKRPWWLTNSVFGYTRGVNTICEYMSCVMVCSVNDGRVKSTLFIGQYYIQCFNGLYRATGSWPSLSFQRQGWARTPTRSFQCLNVPSLSLPLFSSYTHI